MSKHHVSDPKQSHRVLPKPKSRQMSQRTNMSGDALAAAGAGAAAAGVAGFVDMIHTNFLFTTVYVRGLGIDVLLMVTTIHFLGLFVVEFSRDTEVPSSILTYVSGQKIRPRKKNTWIFPVDERIANQNTESKIASSRKSCHTGIKTRNLFQRKNNHPISTEVKLRSTSYTTFLDRHKAIWHHLPRLKRINYHGTIHRR
jgi:hypothetical protein